MAAKTGNIKPFSIKDLLDPEKINRLDDECREMKVERTREGHIIHRDRIGKADNFARLNQMGQRGNKMLEWGVEPEE